MQKQRTFPGYFNFKKSYYNLRSIKHKVAADRLNTLGNNTVPQANLKKTWRIQAVTVQSQPAKFSGLPTENAQWWLDQLEANCTLKADNDGHLINEFKL